MTFSVGARCNDRGTAEYNVSARPAESLGGHSDNGHSSERGFRGDFLGLVSNSAAVGLYFPIRNTRYRPDVWVFTSQSETDQVQSHDFCESNLDRHRDTVHTPGFNPLPLRGTARS